MFPFQGTSQAVPQEWNSSTLAVQGACGENVGLLQRATSCMCMSVSVHLVVTLKGVQVGFEPQGAGVGEAGGSVEVQACQDFYVSDPGCVTLHQVFNPL